jgi:hypothetical protein
MEDLIDRHRRLILSSTVLPDPQTALAFSYLRVNTFV